MQRIDAIAVPVFIEDPLHLRHRGATDQQVEVDEVSTLAAEEVFVSHVAAAGDRKRAVRNEHLVVHAVIDSRELVQAEHPARQERRSPRRERIEEADLDVRVRGQVNEELTVFRRVQVVDKHSNSYSAHCRISHCAQECVTGHVVLQEVVLHIQGALGLSSKG